MQLYDTYRALERHAPLVAHPPRKHRKNDLDYMIDDYPGLEESSNNDFVEYINQAREKIRDDNGDPQLLAWWRNHGEQFPKLARVVRDVLAIQASSVASEQTFSVARIQIGDHRYLLAKDSLEIPVLFRDWINAERRNFGLPKLSAQVEDEIDEILRER